MNTYFYSFLVPIFAIFMFQSCDKQVLDDKKDLPGEADEQLIEAIEETSWELLLESYEEHKTTLISPLSIQYALYMALRGAEGETKKELLEVLKLNDNAGLNTHFQDLLHYLDFRRNEDRLSISNAMFHDPQRIQVNTEYSDILEQYFESQIATADFESENALLQINGWAEDATEGKIKKVLDRIPDDEIMFLLNALYMKASWVNGFPEEWTTDRIFHNSKGEEEEHPFMSNDAQYAYMQSDTETFLSMPLADSLYSAEFYMPRDLDLSEALDKMNFSYLSELRKQATPARAIVNLPKLKIKYHKEFKNYLKNMGIERAFSEAEAEFGKMGTADGRIFLSRVLHDTYFEMDETGIEGAAVTTIGVGVTSAPPVLTFDRPFLLQIREEATGIPVFAGIIQTVKGE